MVGSALSKALIMKPYVACKMNRGTSGVAVEHLKKKRRLRGFWLFLERVRSLFGLNHPHSGIVVCGYKCVISFGIIV